MVILLSFTISLAISYFAAKEFEQIAAQKGHTEKKYFWWCFLLLAIGALMVIALPDCSNKNNAFSDELPTL